jgi:uncharacterized membrane protein YedE/YeeE
MQDVFEMAIVFTAIVTTVKIIADWRLRTKLIEKGLVDEKVKFLYADGLGNAMVNLKWGLVLVGIGLAALIGQWFEYYIEPESVIGLIFIFAGLGFLIYYAVASKQIKSERRSSGASIQS